MLWTFNCIIRFSFYVIRFLMFAHASIMVWIVFYETLVEYFFFLKKLWNLKLF
jgi:hypothetical protein